jgi:Fe-S oxidoreductase
MPPSEGWAKMQQCLDRTGRSVFAEKVEDWPSEGDIAFFPGCLSDARLVDAVRASIRLLEASGERPFVPKGWACCGSPVEKIGDLGRLEKVKAVNADALDGIGSIVASCPGCTAYLQEAHGKSALHIVEHLHSHGNLSSSMFDKNEPQSCQTSVFGWRPRSGGNNRTGMVCGASVTVASLASVQ